MDVLRSRATARANANQMPSRSPSITSTHGRIRSAPPSGDLIKRVKPGQETRLELPVIGGETVRAAAASGLAGIAIEAGGVLLASPWEVRDEADRAGLFVVGVVPPA